MENSHAPNPSPVIKCFNCPVCGSEPLFFLVNVTPWLCVNDDCQVIGWDPYVPAAKCLSDRYKIDLVSENTNDAEL